MFKQKFKEQKNNPGKKISILFLGDSHLQGGYNTNRIRNLFREQGINTGRGIIFPYKFAKKYGPEDILFSSTANWSYLKWNDATSISPVGFEISTFDTSFDIQISFNKNEAVYPFQKIVLFHTLANISVNSNDIAEIKPCIKLIDNVGYTEIYLKNITDSCLLNFNVPLIPNGFHIFSFYMEKMEEALTLNSLGINGITFKAYNEKIDLKPWLSYMNPDCIILSLGTNDIYYKSADTSELRKSITHLVEKLRLYRPNAVIILTTPNEHLINKKYINPRLYQLCKTIRDIAVKEKCGLWDFHNLMKLTGGAQEWHRKGFLFRDYIHLSKNGYKYQGELFFEALINQLNH